MSKEYYNNRVDRYFLIENRQLWDYFIQIFEVVEKYSFYLNNDGLIIQNNLQNDLFLNPDSFLQSLKHDIYNILENKTKIKNFNEFIFFLFFRNSTWICPFFTFNPIGLNMEEEILTLILKEDITNATLSTGYLNFSKTHQNILKSFKFPIHSITSLPEVWIT